MTDLVLQSLPKMIKSINNEKWIDGLRILTQHNLKDIIIETKPTWKPININNDGNEAENFGPLQMPGFNGCWIFAIITLYKNETAKLYKVTAYITSEQEYLKVSYANNKDMIEYLLRSRDSWKKTEQLTDNHFNLLN